MANQYQLSTKASFSKTNSNKKTPYKTIALCETHLKENEKVSIPGYKWEGRNRKDKNDGEIAFLIKNHIVKSCFVEPQTNDGIETMTIRLELEQNKTIIICIYCGKQESKTRKQEAKLLFILTHFGVPTEWQPLVAT